MTLLLTLAVISYLIFKRKKYKTQCTRCNLSMCSACDDYVAQEIVKLWGKDGNIHDKTGS